MLKKAVADGYNMYKKNFKWLLGGFALYLITINLVTIIFEVTVYQLLPTFSVVFSSIFLAPLEIGLIKYLLGVSSGENMTGEILSQYGNAKVFLRSIVLALFVTGTCVGVKIICDYYQAVINSQSAAQLSHSVIYITAYILNILLSVIFFACYYVFAKYEHQNIFKTLAEGIKKSLRHFFSIAAVQILAFLILTGISAFSFWLVGHAFSSLTGENVILLGRINSMFIMLIQLFILPLVSCIKLKLAENII